MVTADTPRSGSTYDRLKARAGPLADRKHPGRNSKRCTVAHLHACIHMFKHVCMHTYIRHRQCLPSSSVLASQATGQLVVSSCGYMPATMDMGEVSRLHSASRILVLRVLPDAVCS